MNPELVWLFLALIVNTLVGFSLQRIMNRRLKKLELESYPQSIYKGSMSDSMKFTKLIYTLGFRKFEDGNLNALGYLMFGSGALQIIMLIAYGILILMN